MYAFFDKYYRAKQKSTEFKIDWNQFTGKMINKSVLRVHSDVHFQGKRRFYIHKLIKWRIFVKLYLPQFGSFTKLITCLGYWYGNFFLLYFCCGEIESYFTHFSNLFTKENKHTIMQIHFPYTWTQLAQLVCIYTYMSQCEPQ